VDGGSSAQVSIVRRLALQREKTKPLSLSRLCTSYCSHAVKVTFVCFLISLVSLFITNLHKSTHTHLLFSSDAFIRQLKNALPNHKRIHTHLLIPSAVLMRQLKHAHQKYTHTSSLVPSAVLMRQLKQKHQMSIEFASSYAISAGLLSQYKPKQHNSQTRKYSLISSAVLMRQLKLKHQNTHRTITSDLLSQYKLKQQNLHVRETKSMTSSKWKSHVKLFKIYCAICKLKRTTFTLLRGGPPIVEVLGRGRASRVVGFWTDDGAGVAGRKEFDNG
jgi:hypothetical protein